MRFIFLDLEFNQKSGWVVDITRGQDIIQIAYTITDDKFESSSEKNFYIKCNYYEINEKIKKLTGITFDNIKSGTTFFYAAKEFMKELSQGDLKETYLVTWGDSDIKILKRNLYKHKIKSGILDKIKVLDAQKAYMLKNNLKDHPSLVKIFEIESKKQFDKLENNHHNAFYDVKALIEISKILGSKYLYKIYEAAMLDNLPLKESLIDRSIKIKLSNEKFRKYYTNRFNCKECGKFTKLIFNDYICLDIISERRYHSQIRYCKRCNKVFIKRENVTNKHKVISSRIIGLQNDEMFDKVMKKNILNYKSGETKLNDFLCKQHEI
ncbi:MAG: exonuclease domain-containing protein [Sarcina sp.]